MTFPSFIPEVDIMTEDDGERWEHPDGFTLSWAATGWGFGLFSFARRDDGSIYCGDEYLGLDRAKLALRTFCENTHTSNWPSLIVQYGGVEGLLDAITDWESKPR